jgi:glycosyltransferase involved in cell wall biosynthesis
MRILYWIGRIGEKFGGCERYNVLLAEKCASRGHQIIVVHDNPNTVPEYNMRLKTAGSEQIVIGDTYTDAWHVLPRAARFVRHWSPDVVHAHFVNPLALPLLKLFRVPLVYQTWHNSINHRIAARTRLIRYIGSYCTQRMLAVSERVRQDEIRAGVPMEHIRRLYLGLPLREFVASATKRSEPDPLGFDSPAFKVIITVARFFPQKGMQFVVDAAINVLRQCPDVVWWLVGDGPEREPLERRAAKAEVADRLLFLGVRNDVAALMSRAYVHVLGSLFEGFGLVAIEAAALGVPTIGTRIGGLDEAILDGTTGILVPKQSSSALTQATMWFLADPDLRNRFGNAAKQYVFTHFDSERLIDELLDMYESDLRELTK